MGSRDNDALNENNASWWKARIIAVTGIV